MTTRTLIGRQDATETDYDPHREEIRWIGKPWRRIELLTNRHYYKGEEVDRSRTITAHVGLRRFGLALTITVLKASYLEYADEPQ